MEMLDPNLIKLSKYVNAAADLAEGLEADIKLGKTVSSRTILNLSKFITAAVEVEKMLDMFRAEGVKLN